MIVSVDAKAVQVICIVCGRERAVAYKDIETNKEDDACMRPPDCPCGATEVWHWHDDVVIVRRTKLVQIGTAVGDGEPIYELELVEEVRPDDPRAMLQQMVEDVAIKVGGLKKAKRNQPRNGKLHQYPTKPEHLKPETVRNGVALGLMRQGKAVLPAFLP